MPASQPASHTYQWGIHPWIAAIAAAAAPTTTTTINANNRNIRCTATSNSYNKIIILVYNIYVYCCCCCMKCALLAVHIFYIYEYTCSVMYVYGDDDDVVVVVVVGPLRWVCSMPSRQSFHAYIYSSMYAMCVIPSLQNIEANALWIFHFPLFVRAPCSVHSTIESCIMIIYNIICERRQFWSIPPKTHEWGANVASNF